MLSDVIFSHFCIDNHEYKIVGKWQKTERKNVENRGGTKHVGARVTCGKWRLYFRHFSFRYFSFRSFATISKIMAPRVDLPLL